MPDYPADVGGAEHHVAGALDAEKVADGKVEAYCVAAGGAKNAFGKTCSSCIDVSFS